MADFRVTIRTGAASVSRPVLDLQSGDLETDSAGRVRAWRNSAPPAWSAGDPRFGDAVQSEPDLRPWVGEHGGPLFREGYQTGLVVPLDVGFGAASHDWTIAARVYPGDRTGKQAVLHATGVALWRISSSGSDHGFQTSAGERVTSGDMPTAGYLWAFDGGGTADLLRDNAEVLSNETVNPITFSAGTTALRLGFSASGDYLDGEIRRVMIWNRVLGAKERDHVFRTLGGADYSAGVSGTARARVQRRSWTDGTGQLALRQVQRVNASGGKHQQFFVARMPGGAPVIVQLACETDGEVVADSGLGGDLYALNVIERPGPSAPSYSQDSGRSSVFDLRVAYPGHYTLLLERPNHGAVYVHLDAEVVEAEQESSGGEETEATPSRPMRGV